MLYANEKVRIWDAETGQDYEDIQVDRQDAEVKQLIVEGRQLEALKNTEGWGLVNKFLTACVQDYKEKLTIESDYKKIRRLQEAIKAYSNVGAFVDWKINEGKSFDNQQTPRSEG